MELPKKRDRWMVPAYRIRTLLQKAGFRPIETSSSLILFQRRRQRRFPDLERALRRHYEERFPTLHIRSLHIRPAGYTLPDFIFNDACAILLPEGSLRRNRGTFTLRCGTKRFFFRYRIDAKIGIYKANHQIKKDKIIRLSDVTFATVPFETLYAMPLTAIDAGRMMARQNILRGRPLLQTMVVPVPAVRRHERVRCVLQEGDVTLEFEGTALQNGAIGEKIPVRKPDGKTIRGTVMADKTVKIQ